MDSFKRKHFICKHNSVRCFMTTCLHNNMQNKFIILHTLFNQLYNKLCSTMQYDCLIYSRRLFE